MNSMISSQNSAKDMIMSEAIIEIMKMKGEEVKGEEVKGEEMKDYETKTIDKFLNPSTREIIMEEAAHDAKVCEMNVKSLK